MDISDKEKEAGDDCRLYLISPPAIDLDLFAQSLMDALSGGDVASFQLRLKNCSDDDIRNATMRLMPICVAHDCAFILNDSVSLAKELKTDGVHLGQGDGDPRAARKILGYDKAIGVTCHNSRHLAFEAGEAGADYIAFGAFYPTKTKETSYRADPELLSWWAEISELPVVAIGGITLENAKVLQEAGANFIAVSSAVWDHPEGCKAAVAAFNALLNN